MPSDREGMKQWQPARSGSEGRSELPGLQVKGRNLARLRLFFGDRALENLSSRKAVLAIDVKEITDCAEIHIEGFSGALTLSVRADKAVVKVGDCRGLRFSGLLYGDASLSIGDATSINNGSFVVEDGGIVIGTDCMFSHEVHLQACDQHGIVDIDNMAIVNDKRMISVGDHVWLGRRALLCPGTQIGNGSVAAAGAVVTRRFGERVIVAGNPARIIREGVTWTRPLNIIDDECRAYLSAPPSSANQQVSAAGARIDRPAAVWSRVRRWARGICRKS
jgi:acetyltransferase-like isoleucine patch superfamily enzyme